MIGRTAEGRGTVRLVWEYKTLGSPFDGWTSFTSPGPTRAPPGHPGAREALGDPVVADAGDALQVAARTFMPEPSLSVRPVFSVPDNSTTELDLRTGAPRSSPRDAFGRGGLAREPR